MKVDPGLFHDSAGEIVRKTSLRVIEVVIDPPPR